MTPVQTKIEFRPVTLADREKYQRLLDCETGRGCEASFANLYAWGRQSIAFVEGQALLFSQFDRRTVYPYPIGPGDKRAAIDLIIADAASRGIPCRITGLSDESMDTLRELYPDRFYYHCDRGTFDYVYDINDLADLKGRKYQKKRNHVNRFLSLYPDYSTAAITEDNITDVTRMIEDWYDQKSATDPDGDYQMEHIALRRALKSRDELGMESMVLFVGGRVAAMTMASRIHKDTFDVHFEKAVADIDGAYAMINREFAGYIRQKHPEAAFLNREEDMGIEGLRKAKESYLPHHMVKKCWAHLMEKDYEY